MLTRLTVLVSVVIGLCGYGAGCVVSSDFSGTAFLCSETNRCPTGQTCIDGRCRSAPIDASIDAEATTGSPIGDLLTYSFDEPETSVENVHDRSGKGHLGFGPRDRELGKFGMAPRLMRDGSAVYYIPYYQDLYPGKVSTIEMWLKRDQAGVEETLLSDAISAVEPRYVHVGISASDHPVFARRDGCNGVVSTVTGEAATIAANQWVHLAVTHGNGEVNFYLDGVLTDTKKLIASPCDNPAVLSLIIGADRDDKSRPFAGLLDELKLSSRVKNQTDIQASMRTPLENSICGDQLIELAEDCEVGALCCLSSCAFDLAASVCGDGGIGQCVEGDGLCEVPAARSRENLVAEYSFSEGMGMTIADSSPLGSLPLTIADLTNVQWVSDGLQVKGPASITSKVAATKLTDQLMETEQLTIEAWVTPLVNNRGGPTRIITLSLDTNQRNFMLGQEFGEWAFRLRTTLSTDNGIPSLITSDDEAVPNRLTHVVATYQSGHSLLYVNGQLRASFSLSGGFSRWSNAFQLAIANELGAESRTWRGTFHHLAIFSRALSATDVAASFALGIPKPQLRKK